MILCILRFNYYTYFTPSKHIGIKQKNTKDHRQTVIRYILMQLGPVTGINKIILNIIYLSKMSVNVFILNVTAKVVFANGRLPEVPRRMRHPLDSRGLDRPCVCCPSVLSVYIAGSALPPPVPAMLLNAKVLHCQCQLLFVCS